MSHVLVKWPSEASWDVYPVRSLAEVEIAFRLLSDENAICELRGTVVTVNWKLGEPPAPAELLDFGKCQHALFRSVASCGQSISRVVQRCYLYAVI